MLSEHSMPEEGLFLKSSVQLVELVPCTGGLCHVGDQISVGNLTRPVDGGGLMGRKWGVSIQGYLAHEKTLTPLDPPQDPRHRPTVGSWGGGLL